MFVADFQLAKSQGLLLLLVGQTSLFVLMSEFFQLAPLLLGVTIALQQLHHAGIEFARRVASGAVFLLVLVDRADLLFELFEALG